MLYITSKDQQSSPCGPVVVTIFDSDRKLLYFSRCGENRAEKQSKAGEKMSPWRAVGNILVQQRPPYDVYDVIWCDLMWSWLASIITENCCFTGQKSALFFHVGWGKMCSYWKTTSTKMMPIWMHLSWQVQVESILFGSMKDMKGSLKYL